MTDPPVPDPGDKQARSTTVLLVEENEVHGTMALIALGRLGYRVVTASRGGEALRLVSRQAFDAFVLDSKIRDMSVFDLVSSLATRFPDVPCVLLVPPGSEDLLIRGMKSGASAHVAKTPRFQEVLPSVVEAQLRHVVDHRLMLEQEHALAEGGAARRRELDIREAMFEVSEAASRLEDPESFFRAIHRIVGKLMPAGNFYIALIDPDDGSVSFPYFVDEKDPAPDPQPFGRGLTEYVYRTGEPLLADPGVFQQLLAKGAVDAVGAPSVDWLGVPLIADGRSIGVLVVQTYADRVRLGVTERDVLAYVSTQVAMAISRVRKDGELRESQRTLSAVMANVPGMVYRARSEPPDLRFEFVSEGAALTGYRPDDFLQARVDRTRLVDPADAPWVQEEIAAAIREVRPFQLVYRIRTATGETRWVWEQGRPTPSPRGTILEGLVTDITEPKRIEDELRVSQERFELVGRATNDVIWDWDVVEGTMWWSSAIESRFGHALGDIKPSVDWWVERVHPTDRDRIEGALRKTLEGSATHWEADYRFRRHDGSYADVSDRAFVIRDREGKPVRAIGSLLDLTERKKAERQTAETERLEALSQMAFYVAHEINTPLTSISLLTSSLERSTADPVVAEKLAKIHKYRRQASAIASGLPGLSSRTQLLAIMVDVRTLVEEALVTVGPYRKPRVELGTRLGDHPILLRVDPSGLKTVVGNLVKNALQATEAGSVTIALDEEEDGVHIRVEDTGTGISEDVAAHLFEPFFSTKNPEGAAGLGLAWCKKLVEAHGGRILVRSMPGQGATFTVVLPRALASGS